MTERGEEGTKRMGRGKMERGDRGKKMEEG